MWEKHIVVFINIYVARAISEYLVITKTLNLSKEKWILVYLDQYLPIQKQGPYGTTVSIPHKMKGKCCCSYSYLWECSHFLLFMINKTLNPSHQKKEIGVSGTLFLY